MNIAVSRIKVWLFWRISWFARAILLIFLSTFPIELGNVAGRDGPRHRSAVIPLRELRETVLAGDQSPAPFGRYVERINGVLLELVRVPNGSFMMGNDSSPFPAEKPAHLVRMRSFYIGQYEVTREQWNMVADTLPRVNRDLTRQFIGPVFGFTIEKTSPADAMFWADAVEFCDRLTRATGKKYRLPSEAEWEYACRAGSTTEYSFGDQVDFNLAHLRNVANGDPSFDLLPVGKKGYHNAWGLYEMHGNVSEWCLDRKHENYVGAPDDGREWVQGGTPNERLQRGGYYAIRAELARSSSRNFYATALRASGFGLRVVAEVNPVLTGQVSVSSAASYSNDGLAIESIAAVFGNNLATDIQHAAGLPLPLSLAGTSVSIEDSEGKEHLAPIFFASPDQINCQIPAGISLGPAFIRVVRSDGTVATGTALIKRTSPGLFSADSTGVGLAAALTLTISSNGDEVYTPVAIYDEMTRKFVANSVDLSNPTDQVFLILFGTGFRHKFAVTAHIDGEDTDVLFADAQGTYWGLDQCNVRLSQRFAGRGEVSVKLTVDGEQSNTVKIVTK